MVLEIRGLNKVRKFTARLSKAMTKEIRIVNNRFMRNVQKSAKLRAPRITGKLAESINLRKKRKNEIRIIVDSPYGYFQEFGFTPHLVSAWAPTRTGTGLTIGEIYGIPYGRLMVAKHKPFIIPALEINIAKLPNLLNKGAKKAINKARK